MTVYDDVITTLREFKRYTGDGLPNEPVGAPLPVGDPASGVWNPKKSDLRGAFGGLAQLLDQFGTTYLGAKATDPTTDNDGDALADGAFYWNTERKQVRFYDAGDDAWFSAGWKYQGTWSGAVSYEADDVVEYGGSIWFSLRDNTNVEPTEGADWTLFLPGVTVADGSVTFAKLDPALVQTDAEGGDLDADDELPTVKRVGAILNTIYRDTEFTVTVGDGGDYASLDECIVAMSKLVPVHVPGRISNADTIGHILLLTGYGIDSSVVIEGLNLGWLDIVSEDAEVIVQQSGLDGELAALQILGAVSPNIGTVFKLDGSGSPRDGLMVNFNSYARIYSGCGFINSGRWNLRANASSRIDGENCVATGGERGIYVHRSSVANIDGATMTGNDYGVVSNGGIVSAAGVDASNCDRGFFAQGGGFIGADDSFADDCNEYGYYAFEEGRINAQEGSADRAGIHGVYAYVRSSINFRGGSAVDAGSNGIYAQECSEIDAQAAIATGAGSNGIYANIGSRISAVNSNARKGGGDSVDDYRVASGGIIVKQGGTGGTSETINTLTSRGIIFG